MAQRVNAQFRQFAVAVVKHVRLIVTSSLLLVIVGLAQTFGPSGHTLLYGAACAVIIIIAIIGGAYRAWNDQKREKENAMAELARRSYVTSAEWKELTARFEKLTKHTEAQLQTNRMHGQITSEEWTISGYAESKQTCEALCGYAGTLLLKSPNISSKLSAHVQNEPNPAWAGGPDHRQKCNSTWL